MSVLRSGAIQVSAACALRSGRTCAFDTFLWGRLQLLGRFIFTAVKRALGKGGIKHSCGSDCKDEEAIQAHGR